MHKQFAERLNQVWDHAGVPRGDKRTAAVADRFGVSRESARKWGRGLSIPKDERLRAISVQLDISYEWLSTGRGTMEGIDLSVRETPNKYDSAELVRLNGLVRNLSRKKQRALIQLLEDER